MTEVPQPTKRDDLPYRGLTLSDCLGIIVGAAVLFGIWRLHGPTVWLPASLRRAALGSWDAWLMLWAIKAGGSVCVFGLAAGPTVMIPRVVRWGWWSMAISESGWLIGGCTFLVILLGDTIGQRVFDVSVWTLPLLMFAFVISAFVWFCDIVPRTATPRPAVAELGAPWTQQFSLALCLCFVGTVILMVISQK